MVTLNNADSVLKSFYLDAVTDALNTKINPFLAKIGKTSANISGKDVKKVLSCGFNNGIGAGTETGDLPTANGNEYNQMVVGLKNFYGTLEISDKAIRAAADSDGAFVNLLNEEMRTLINTAKLNFGRILFGDGSGVLSTVLDVMDNCIEVDNVQNFVAGMIVDFVLGSTIRSGLRVVAVDNHNNTIIFESGEALVGMENAEIVLPGSGDNELTGLAAIFGNDALYGLERSVIGMKPYIIDDAVDVTDAEIQFVIDNIESNSGSKPDIIICSWQVRRALMEYYRNHNITLPTIEIEGGFKAFDFNGVPIVVDRFCPKNAMYLLNSENFKLHQLCDWQWLETEDGKILKQTPGKPVYTATLVKYAELLCDNPSAQGMILFTNV